MAGRVVMTSVLIFALASCSDSATESGESAASTSVAAAVTDASADVTEPAAELQVDTVGAIAALQAVATGEPGTPLDDCPLGNPAALPAPVPNLPAFDDAENLVINDTGVRCILRVSGSEPFTAISVEASLGAAVYEDYFASGSFMVPVDRVPLAGGELVTECPREQTQGDTPEHCEATWLAPDGEFAVAYDYSGPGTSAEAVAGVLTSSLATLVANLAAAPST